ncbi:MAG: hypothetical protein M0Z70_11730 [Nitrospiraceae bacterium]|nr:hypothetical protein [Nitrospiraceae bacterium]
MSKELIRLKHKLINLAVLFIGLIILFLILAHFFKATNNSIFVYIGLVLFAFILLVSGLILITIYRIRKLRKSMRVYEEPEQRFKKTLKGKQLAFDFNVNGELLTRSAYFLFGVVAMFLLLSSQFSVLFLNLSFLRNFNSFIVVVSWVVFSLLVMYFVSVVRYLVEFLKWKKQVKARGDYGK